jgi:class 3 adenylate cyclase
VLINWQTLKEDSNIYNEFENEKMQFILTRTDIDKDTGKENAVIIAQSNRPDLICNDNVTLVLDSGDHGGYHNGWVISVGYNDGISPNYMSWALPIIIAVAFLFTIMLMLVLVSKEEHERLLGNLMPPRAINKLRKGETVVERYSNVTIFFSDIVGYTSLSTQMTPVEVMQMLSDLYTQMDVLAKKRGVYKVETIGDAYIAIAGAPNKCTGPEAAEKLTLFALDALQCVRDFRKRDDGAGIAIRVGLASGPVVAGVIGTSLPKYTLFGDTVNFAARMEQTSKQMQLQVCPLTHRMLLDAPMHNFIYKDRLDDDGELGIEVKGKGRQFTYWVTGASKLDEKRARKSYTFVNEHDNAGDDNA